MVINRCVTVAMRNLPLYHASRRQRKVSPNRCRKFETLNFRQRLPRAMIDEQFSPPDGNSTSLHCTALHCTALYFVKILKFCLTKRVDAIYLLFLVEPLQYNRSFHFPVKCKVPPIRQHGVTRNFLSRHWKVFFWSLQICNRSFDSSVPHNQILTRH